MAYNIKKMVITFLSQQEKVLVRHRVLCLPIREDQLILKSIEFFNDPEPCMIHRSAVINRLYTEILDFLIRRLSGQGGTLDWSEFPSTLAAYLVLPDPKSICQVRLSLDDE
jgi:hypothetical protein